MPTGAGFPYFHHWPQGSTQERFILNITRLKESTETAFKRISTGLKNWRENTTQAARLMEEAHRLKIWESKYDSFADFCELECGITRQWAYDLMLTAKTVREIQGVVLDDSGFPDLQSLTSQKVAQINPKHVRALNGLSPAQKAKVLADTLRVTGGRMPTPEAVKKRADIDRQTTVRPVNPDAYTSRPTTAQAKPQIELDKTGWPIPEKLLPIWNRMQEVQDLITHLSRVKGALVAAQEDKDVMFVEVNFSSAIADLTNAFTTISRAKPYAVCTSCQGRVPDKCTFCHGKGFISEFRWKTSVPQELKTIREKARK